MAYKKCPRCNLNYIKDTDVLCKICAEDVDKALRGNDDGEDEYDICPECGESIIKAGEEMCYRCMMESIDKGVKEEGEKKDDEWDVYSADDPDDDIIVDNDEDDLGELNIIDEDFEDDDMDDYEDE